MSSTLCSDTRDSVCNFGTYLAGPAAEVISWGPQMEVYHTFDHEGNYLNSGYFPSLKAEFMGQTFVSVLYAKEMELLRPRDFSVLTSNQKYIRHTTEFSLDTSLIAQSRSTWTTALAAGSTMIRPTTSLPFWPAGPASIRP
jgi:hypothetical protein